MKLIYDTESGHDKPDTKIKTEYDITYKCRKCGNELCIENIYCSNCGKWIDWLDILKIESNEE